MSIKLEAWAFTYEDIGKDGYIKQRSTTEESEFFIMKKIERWREYESLGYVRNISAPIRLVPESLLSEEGD